MKNALLALLLLLAACKKNKDNEQEMDPTLKDKLQGKWQLVRAVDETWEPITTLAHTEDNPVGPGDSIVIKDYTLFGYYDGPNGVEVDELPLAFASNNLIFIDEEWYQVKKLTDTELILQQDDIDRANNRKDVIINYLTR